MLSFPKVVFALLVASALAKSSFLQEPEAKPSALAKEPEPKPTVLASSSGHCTAADIKLLKKHGSIPDGPDSLGALQAKWTWNWNPFSHWTWNWNPFSHWHWT